MDVNNKTNIFYDKIYKILYLHVPRKQTHTNKYPVWFSCNLKKLTVKKERVRKQEMSTTSSSK